MFLRLMLLRGVWYCLATEVPDALPLRMRVHVACHGVGSNALPVALVGECSMPHE